MLDTTTSNEDLQESSKTIIDNTETDKTTEQVLDEIEEKIAKESENQKNKTEETFPNYDEMDLEKLVDSFKIILDSKPIQSINNHVNAIKSSFDAQFSKILAAKKSQFLSEGGESINFSYSNPLKNEFNELFKKYKDQRNKYFKNLESELKSNLELRTAVIEQLKDLIENAEPTTMYNRFRDIQERWKKIGPVAREKYNDTWRTYHHHVERFYDLLHMSNDFRDFDFKKNFDKKMKIIAKAEVLAKHDDVNYAFKQLQILHKMWKEDIGPVAREQREDVWRKFSDATKKIHDKRHENFKKLKDKYQENLVKKNEIISQIENLNYSSNSAHSQWQASIKEVENLRNKFFKIGGVSKSDSEKIWTRFKEATKKFNREKNAFYKKVKSNQQENLDKKYALIAKAEELKDSEDWESVTEIMKKIQSDWKKIGHVPRKYSDKIWNQFKSACNHYFDRYHQQQKAGSKEEQEAYEKKRKFLNEIKESTKKVDLDAVKQYTKSWSKLGRVPYNLRRIDTEFSSYLDSLFSQLSIDGIEKEMVKYESQIISFLGEKNLKKLDNEQVSIRKKIDESVREIQQLENNMSFFTDNGKNNPLLNNVVKKLDSHKENLKVLKSKLNFLNQLDY